MENSLARPLLEPSPTGLPARKAELDEGDFLPGRICVEDVEDALQAGAGRVAKAPGVSEASGGIREYRFKELPQLISYLPTV